MDMVIIPLEYSSAMAQWDDVFVKNHLHDSRNHITTCHIVYCIETFAHRIRHISLSHMEQYEELELLASIVAYVLLFRNVIAAIHLKQKNCLIDFL